uniref:Uncharacterized protein n=1 Tax=Rhizophora mucronata TaxID=61149 RepID=A0A2P2Q6M4_RHIMU
MIVIVQFSEVSVGLCLFCGLVGFVKLGTLGLQIDAEFAELNIVAENLCTRKNDFKSSFKATMG